MTRYRYAPMGGRPPPFVHVTLPNLSVNPVIEVADLPAQLDSGADRTVIPDPLVHQLQLIPFSSLDVAGLGGAVARLPAYLVVIEIRNQKPLAREVLAPNGLSG